MARVSIYLNFMGTTEEAFELYRSAFGGEFAAFRRFRETPPDPEAPPLPETDLDKVMHVELPILGGTSLMGTDLLESMGHELRVGNTMSITLEPDTLEETQRLFDALSAGGSEIVPLQPMFWGSHWGTCVDRFGVRWMFDVASDAA
jgi:PhnB protein